MTIHLYLVASHGRVIVASAKGATAVWAPLWSASSIDSRADYPADAPPILAVESLVQAPLADVLQVSEGKCAFDNRYAVGFVAVAASSLRAPESRVDSDDLRRFYVGPLPLAGPDRAEPGTVMQRHFSPIGLLWTEKGHAHKLPWTTLQPWVEPHFLPDLPGFIDPLEITKQWLEVHAGVKGLRVVPRYRRLSPPGESRGIQEAPIDRHEVLERIRSEFEAHQVVVLTGQAGVGKTQIAQAHARICAAERNFVVYLGAKGRTIFRRLTELGERDPAALDVWEKALRDPAVRVVLDDPVAMEDFLAGDWKAKVLVTSREPPAVFDSRLVTVPIDALTQEETVTHLQSVLRSLKATPLSGAEATSLGAALGGLPIAIRLAAAALKAGTPVASLMDRLGTAASALEPLLQLQWKALAGTRRNLLCLAARIGDPEGVPLRRLALFTGEERSTIIKWAEELERKGFCTVIGEDGLDLHPEIRAFLLKRYESTEDEQEKDPPWFTAVRHTVAAYGDTGTLVDAVLQLGSAAPQEDLDAAQALVPQEEDVPVGLRHSMDRFKGERARTVEYLQAEAANFAWLPRARRGALIAQQIHNAVVAAAGDRYSWPHVAKSLVRTARSCAKRAGGVFLWLSRRSRRVTEAFRGDAAQGEGAVNALVASDDEVVFPVGVRGVRRVPLFGSYRRPPDQDTDAVWALASSSNGRVMVSGTDDNEINVWPLLGEGAGPGAPWRERHDSWINAVAVSPDGTWAVAGEDHGTLTIWGIGAGEARRKEARFPRVHAGWVLALAIAADGRHFVSGGQDGSIKLWAREGGSVRFVQEIGQRPGWIRGLALTSDGKLVATSSDTTVTVWELGLPDASGAVRASGLVATLEGHHAWVRAVAITPDGRHAVTGGDDGLLRIWTLTGPHAYKELTSLAGHNGLVRTVAVTPDGRHLVSGGTDGNIKVWDLKRATACVAPATESEPTQRGVTALTCTGTGEAVAWFEDGSFSYHGRHCGAQQWPGPRQFGRVEATAIADDGRVLFAASADGTIWRWDLGAKKLWRIGRQDGVRALGWSAADRRLLAASTDGRVTAFGVDKREESTVLAWAPPGPAATPATPLLVRPDRAAFYGADRRLWLTGPAGSRSVWLPVGPPDALAVTGDLAFVVTARRNELTVLRLDEDGARSVGHASLGGLVQRIAVTNDGHSFLVGDRDGTMYWFDLEELPDARTCNGDKSTEGAEGDA